MGGRPGRFADMTGNPLLSLFLENHIGALSQQLHANPRYLKNAIRAGLARQGRVVTPARSPSQAAACRAGMSG